ncbi:hypothetical protein D3C85_1054810 [compost metagenome]
MKVLKFCMYGQCLAGDTRHAQQVMREMGINYKKAVSQSINDSWHFWGVENVPEELPKWMQLVEWDPQEFVGWGLSQEGADFLTAQGEKP